MEVIINKEDSVTTVRLIGRLDTPASQDVGCRRYDRAGLLGDELHLQLRPAYFPFHA